MFSASPATSPNSPNASAARSGAGDFVLFVFGGGVGGGGVEGTYARVFKSAVRRFNIAILLLLTF